MKKTLSLIALLAGSIVAVGQGQIRFANTGQTLISTNSLSGGGSGPISGARNYYFGLFSAPSGTVDPSAFEFTGFYGTNTAAGFFRGGVATIPDTIPSVTVLAFLVRTWSANIGHDYSAVTDYLANPTFDAWYGESQIAIVTLGFGDPVPPPPIFGFGPGQIPGFTLEMHTVPEPSSFTLAGLGVATLWIFRRRSP